MVNLRSILFTPLFASTLVSLAACSSNGRSDGITADAQIAITDGPPEAPPDGPPGDPTSYNLSCAGMALPTTAPATVTINGRTESIGEGQPLDSVDIQIFRAGTPAPLVSTTSDATGTWTSGALNTNGVPIDGSIRAAKATYRTTYVFPPQAISADVPGAPIPLIPSAMFDALGSQFNQDDTAHGAFMIVVTDCMGMPISDATLSVQQGGAEGGAEVGTQLNLGAMVPQAAGIYFVFNVPAGPTLVNASYQSTSFLAHTVVAFSKSASGDPDGSISTTILRPGPL
ncbi:MAG TPA: hypothetical protein VN253_08605 [Kofleriaceae bacterium]|nr:hypothetical protein [Kofleriaceae bacterium]